MIAMDTGRNHLHQLDGEHFINPLQHMCVGFNNFDPAIEKKLAVHPDLPIFTCSYGNRVGTLTQEQATGDLTLIVFYYLLRVGEYTSKHRQWQET